MANGKTLKSGEFLVDEINFQDIFIDNIILPETPLRHL